MRLPLATVIGGALGVLAIRMAISPGPADRPAPAVAVPSRAEASARAAAPAAVPPAGAVPSQAADAAAVPADGAAGAPVPPRILRAVDDALARHIDAAGLAVGPDDRAALRTALLDVRRASRRSARRGDDHAWQAGQSRALAAADRLFREKLGTGIGDFLAASGPPGRVEDLGRRPPS
jgi:hypothetical protein